MLFLIGRVCWFCLGMEYMFLVVRLIDWFLKFFDLEGDACGGFVGFHRWEEEEEE